MDPYLMPGSSFSRLEAEYAKYNSLIVAFDFDDTVHDLHKKGSSYELMEHLLRELKAINCKLICFTAHPDEEYVKNYLIEHNIPFDAINEDVVDLGWKARKIYFNVLLDDRAGLAQTYRDLQYLVTKIKKSNAKLEDNTETA